MKLIIQVVFMEEKNQRSPINANNIYFKLLERKINQKDKRVEKRKLTKWNSSQCEANCTRVISMRNEKMKKCQCSVWNSIKLKQTGEKRILLTLHQLQKSSGEGEYKVNQKYICIMCIHYTPGWNVHREANRTFLHRAKCKY